MQVINLLSGLFSVEINGIPQSHRKYLKQESEDKKKQDFDTSGWILRSKKRNVSRAITRGILKLTSLRKRIQK